METEKNCAMRQCLWNEKAKTMFLWSISPISSRHQHHRTIAASHYRFIRQTIAIAPSHRSSWLNRTLTLTQSSLNYRVIASSTQTYAMGNYVALSGFQTEYNFCVRIWISYLNHLFPLYYFLISSFLKLSVRKYLFSRWKWRIDNQKYRLS